LIQVFFDESGTHEPSEVIISGVAWAAEETWRRWTFDWQVQKQPIKVYHAVDCHNRDGEFAGWGRAKRDGYVKGLLPVVARHEIEGRIAGFHRQVLEREMRSRPDVRHWMGDPYLTAFAFALRRTWDVLAARGHREIMFVHEVNEYREAIREHFELQKRKHPNSLAMLRFGGKADFVPLQCADILAYEGNHQLRAPEKGLRRPLLALDPTGQRFGFIVYDHEETREMAHRLIGYFDDLRAAEGS
jgi:hypothetical protein